MRYLTEIASSVGSMWTSEAPFFAARPMMYWMIASGALCSQTGLAAYSAPIVSVRGFTPWLFRACWMSSFLTSLRPSSTSPSFLPVSRCSTSASSSWGVVSFFIRIRMSPRRSLLRDSTWISSTSFDGAVFQNSCLYFSLASQKHRKQNGQSFVGFLGSHEHQTALRASNSPRQFQQRVRYVSIAGTIRSLVRGGPLVPESNL